MNVSLNEEYYLEKQVELEIEALKYQKKQLDIQKKQIDLRLEILEENREQIALNKANRNQ